MSMIPKHPTRTFAKPELIRGVSFTKQQLVRLSHILDVARTQLPGVKIKDYTVHPAPGDRALCIKMIEAQLLRPHGVEWDGTVYDKEGRRNPQLEGVCDGSVYLELTDFGRTWS